MDSPVGEVDDEGVRLEGVLVESSDGDVGVRMVDILAEAIDLHRERERERERENKNRARESIGEIYTFEFLRTIRLFVIFPYFSKSAQT